MRKMNVPKGGLQERYAPLMYVYIFNGKIGHFQIKLNQIEKKFDGTNTW